MNEEFSSQINTGYLYYLSVRLKIVEIFLGEAFSFLGEEFKAL